ncbi:MAG: hypothetical protein H7331_07475 [Bacteroidia bacterium]|nr:hypothetical protein [Bacteroidia bacterium]
MRFTLTLILIITFLCTQAQPIVRNDLTIQLHEETLNKMLKALGNIKGTNTYDVMYVTGTYHWSLIKPTIQLMKDSARFKTDAKVEVGMFKYTDEVVGKVSINYQEKTNQIAVRIIDAPFEIYTTILGKKFVIKRIQIADYFKTPFLFEGPMTMKGAMEFMMPDSTIKTLMAKPSKCDVKILPQRILVSTELEFTTVLPPLPPIPNPVVQPPFKK